MLCQLSYAGMHFALKIALAHKSYIIHRLHQSANPPPSCVSPHDSAVQPVNGGKAICMATALPEPSRIGRPYSSPSKFVQLQIHPLSANPREEHGTAPHPTAVTTSRTQTTQMPRHSATTPRSHQQTPRQDSPCLQPSRQWPNATNGPTRHPLQSPLDAILAYAAQTSDLATAA